MIPYSITVSIYCHINMHCRSLTPNNHKVQQLCPRYESTTLPLLFNLLFLQLIFEASQITRVWVRSGSSSGTQQAASWLKIASNNS